MQEKILPKQKTRKSRDLNELNSSGMPNEFSFGNVGGGYWYNSTSIFTF